MGLTIFGGGLGGSLRYGSRLGKGALVVAGIHDGIWGGGDGSAHRDGDGLLRGE